MSYSSDLTRSLLAAREPGNVSASFLASMAREGMEGTQMGFKWANLQCVPFRFVLSGIWSDSLQLWSSAFITMRPQLPLPVLLLRKSHEGQDLTVTVVCLEAFLNDEKTTMIGGQKICIWSCIIYPKISLLRQTTSPLWVLVFHL